MEHVYSTVGMAWCRGQGMGSVIRQYEPQL